MRLPSPPLVFLIAGEPSGDAIGARLMSALRREHGAPLRFAGVGGERMAAMGLQSLFPMDDISVMGFAEIVPALPRLVMRFRQTVAEARAVAPDAVVGIDSKAFCIRVLGALAADRRLLGSPRREHKKPALLQYVAPSAWAFADAPRRAARLHGTVDELLALLPFEPPLFAAADIPCTFVGHPALDGGGDALPSGTAAADEADRSALCLLPGSRRQEVDANLPLMLQAVELVEPSCYRIDRLLLPTPPSLRAAVEAHLSVRQVSPPVTVLSDSFWPTSSVCG